MDKKLLYFLPFLMLPSVLGQISFTSNGNAVSPGKILTLLSAGLMANIMNYLIIALFVFLAVYVYSAFALMTIAKKTGTPKAWMAWVPVSNFFLMAMIAEIPWWVALILVLSFLIPYIGGLVALAITIFIWWKIAERRGFPGWLSLLMLVPLLNLVMIGYLAWAKGKKGPKPKQFPHKDYKDPRLVQLRVYVKEATDSGMTKAQIREELEKVGWSQDYIRRVL